MRVESQQSAIVLLELMDKYKPHLKPYAYRLHSWERVLADYNSRLHTKYRQIRTIKNKFERLKYMYLKDRGSEQFKGYSEAELVLLERLISESDGVSVKDPIVRDNGMSQGALASGGRPPEPALVPRLPMLGGQLLKQSTINNIIEPTPPPLDTISIGMPKNAKKPSIQDTGLAGQPTMEDSTVTAGTPLDTSIFDGDTRIPTRKNSLDVHTIQDLVRKLSDQQKQEDQLMIMKEAELSKKYMTQADFLSYKKQNRAIQLQILNVITSLLETPTKES